MKAIRPLKGLPKSCSECEFREYTDNGHCKLNIKIHFQEIKYTSKCHPQCPIISLPEIGRASCRERV